MDKDLQKEILSDSQIMKFSLYGFLKDLKFFEPYLLIYLCSNDLSLFSIGILFSIREIIINLFEIPSGLIADSLGRKKELCFCFVFYIISFFIFFLGGGFYTTALAMVFFGLGEAFRSGTHKAMIYTYLERKGWQEYKTFVYGKTRSASLLGSALSSLLGILIILNIPSSRYIFLASTIPYIADFLLILSYPDYLDKDERHGETKFKDVLIVLKNSLMHSKPLRHMLIGEGIFEASVSAIKDFIQPIMEGIIIISGITILKGFSPQDNLNIILGIIYAFINLFGSYASRKSYLLRQRFSSKICLNGFQLLLSVSLLLVGILIKLPFPVIFVYIIINLLVNFRKPIFIAEIDSFIDKRERATILSVASQLKSLGVVVLSPMCGFISDNFGIDKAMFLLSILLLAVFPLSRLSTNKRDSV